MNKRLLIFLLSFITSATLFADCVNDDDCGGSANGKICVSGQCADDCWSCNPECPTECARGAWLESACSASAPVCPVVPPPPPPGCPPEQVGASTDQTANDNYCGCTGGRHVSGSLTCHNATTGWEPFGAACTDPYCEGCSTDGSDCACPADKPVWNSASGQCESDTCENSGAQTCGEAKFCHENTCYPDCWAGTPNCRDTPTLRGWWDAGTCHTTPQCLLGAESPCSADNECEANLFCASGTQQCTACPADKPVYDAQKKSCVEGNFLTLEMDPGTAQTISYLETVNSRVSATAIPAAGVTLDRIVISGGADGPVECAAPATSCSVDFSKAVPGVYAVSARAEGTRGGSAVSAIAGPVTMTVLDGALSSVAIQAAATWMKVNGTLALQASASGASGTLLYAQEALEWTWAVEPGTCTLYNVKGRTAEVRGVAAGSCVVTVHARQARSGGGSNEAGQSVTITVSNTDLRTLLIAPGAVTLLPREARMFTIVGKNAAGKQMELPPDYTVGVSGDGDCKIESLSSTPFGPAYFASVRAGTKPKTSCIVSASAGGLTSQASITISDRLVRITNPINGAYYSLINPSSKVVLSGVVAGDTQVSLSGSLSGIVSAGPPDASGLAPWSFDWTQPSLSPGAKLVNAISSGGSDSILFYAFGPPLTPSLSLSDSILYDGDSVRLTATAADDPRNPGFGPGVGITSVFVNVSGRDDGGGDMTHVSDGPKAGESSWRLELKKLAAGRFAFLAQSTNLAGVTSAPSSPASLRVLSRPTITVSSPAYNAAFTSGTLVNLVARVKDPDRVAQGVEFFVSGQSLGKVSIAGDQASTMWKAAMQGGNPFLTITAVVYYPDLKNPSLLYSNASPPVPIMVIAAPVVTSAAGATPNPVVGGLKTTLSAWVDSMAGQEGLVYRWTQSASDPAPVTFAFGGVGRETQATFTKPGTYVFTCTITDTLGVSVKTSTTVAVTPGLQVSPSPAFALLPGSVHFTSSGQDQFGGAVSLSGGVWSTACPATVGTIDAASGLFTSKGPGGPCPVTLTASGVRGSAMVSVVTNLPPRVLLDSVESSVADYVAPLTLTLTASASDSDDGLKGVQFFANGVAVSPLITRSPYVYSWAGMLPGNYFITAAATDVNGGSAVSDPVAVSVRKPVLAITKVAPPSATTQDNSPTGRPFTFLVEGAGFVKNPPIGQRPSMVFWNGEPRETYFKSGDALHAVLEVVLKNGELLLPQRIDLKVVNPVFPGDEPNANVSAPVRFVVDGEPIIRCLRGPGQSACSGSASSVAGSRSVSSMAAESLRPMSLGDTVSADSSFTEGGIRWTLLAGPTSGSGQSLAPDFRSSRQVITTTSFLPGASLRLSQLPGAGGGVYTLVAEGMNLAGRVSAPASMDISVIANDFNSLVIYPNPWRADQHNGADITLKNLPANTTVKIFDVAGHWVATLPAGGDTVTWDLRNGSGSRVQSGIYFYLATTPDGGKSRGTFTIIR